MTIATLPPIDTSKNLWELKFLCKVPELQTRSVEHIKFFGTPTTGDSAIDKEMANQWITTFKCIDDMVELYKQDIPIKIVNPPDVKRIYDYISKHLHAWKSQISVGLNIGDAPLEDLVHLDRFANTIYEHAKYHFSKEMADSILAKDMSRVVSFNKTNFFKPDIKINEDGSTKINAEEIDPYPKREALGDLFKDRRITTRKWSS